MNLKGFAAVAGAVAVSLAAAALPGAQSDASAQDDGGTGSAARTLDRCLSQKDPRLSVIVLMDESGSLGGRTGTDREGNRVDGLKAALSGIVRLAQTPVTGRTLPKADVLFVGFSGKAAADTSNKKPDWQPATPDNLDALLARAEEFRTRDKGKDTNYLGALTTAKEEFARRAAGQKNTPCQALIWFTDGGYAIKGNPGAVSRGKQDLCRPGGVLDELDDGDVVKFTIGLAPGLNSDDTAFLRSVTTGAGALCRGARLDPDHGEFLTAAASDRLYFRFSELLTPGGPSDIDEQYVCPREPCRRGRLLFKAIPGLSRFIISFSSNTDGLELVLTGPDGADVTVRKGGPERQRVAGTVVSQRWFSDRTVEVEGLFGPGNGWVGPWSYTPVNPVASEGGASLSRATLFTEYQPQVAPLPEVVRGGTTPIEITLVDGHGKPAPAGPLVRDAEVVGAIRDPTTGEVYKLSGPRRTSDGHFVETVRLPATVTATTVSLGLEARFPVLGKAKVAPRPNSYDLHTRFPEGQGYPSFSPSELRLGGIEGEGSTTGRITVQASADSGSCVWVAPVRLTDPHGKPIDVEVVGGQTSETKCLKLARGQRRELVLRFSTDGGAEGTVRGVVPLLMKSDLRPAPRRADVPVSFPVAVPPDTGKRLWLTALLLILGLGFPLLLLHLLNRGSAKFADPRKVRWLEVPLIVDPGMTVTTEDGTAPTAEYVDFVQLDVGSDRREFTLEGIKFTARASGSRREGHLSLLRGPYGVVAGPGPDPVVLSGQANGSLLREWKDFRFAEVPLGLIDSWVFVRDRIEQPERPDVASFDDDEELYGLAVDAPDPPDARRIHGRLIIFTGVAADMDAGRLTLEAAIDRLVSAEAEKALRRTAPPPQTTTTTTTTGAGIADPEAVPPELVSQPGPPVEPRNVVDMPEEDLD